MGFAISWLAVKGKSPEALTEELGLTPTGEMTEYGNPFSPGVCCQADGFSWSSMSVNTNS